MKFVYSGKYTQFMGRVFAFGKPVDVTDKATIAALEKNAEFRKANEEKIEETAQTVLSDECPTCGKIVKRGKFMHQKYCGK
jgi:hypothetical protein